MLTLCGVIQVRVNAPGKHVCIVGWLRQLLLLQHPRQACICECREMAYVKDEGLAQLQRPAMQHDSPSCLNLVRLHSSACCCSSAEGPCRPKDLSGLLKLLKRFAAASSAAHQALPFQTLASKPKTPACCRTCRSGALEGPSQAQQHPRAATNAATAGQWGQATPLCYFGGCCFDG